MAERDTRSEINFSELSYNNDILYIYLDEFLNLSPRQRFILNYVPVISYNFTYTISDGPKPLFGCHDASKPSAVITSILPPFASSSDAFTTVGTLSYFSRDDIYASDAWFAIPAKFFINMVSIYGTIDVSGMSYKGGYIKRIIEGA